jgi:hypothetical protein
VEAEEGSTTYALLAATGSRAGHVLAAEARCVGSISSHMTLEELRERAFFQNTIDVWIMYCAERKWDWYNVDTYRRFIGHLGARGIKMQKFPLCIKESGGMYERGKDKAQFLEQLSKIPSDDAAAYTLKLSGDVIAAIRSFSN